MTNIARLKPKAEENREITNRVLLSGTSKQQFHY